MEPCAGSTPIHKASILPRGRALGVTHFQPNDDVYSLSKEQIRAQIATALGGRAAEELQYGADHVSTGASSDFQVMILCLNFVLLLLLLLFFKKLFWIFI